MEIIDLTKENEELYFLCLEDWSDDIKEAGNHKECWYRDMKDKGLRVKLAKDDKGNIGGMIQYLPIEYSIVDGKDLYFITCIWIHGHKQGRGNFQKKGMGKALLQAAEEDVKTLGAKGISAWGLSLPVWMKASWFKKHGYKKVDKLGSIMAQVLLWKTFSDDAVPPKWIKQRKKPEKIKDKVIVTGFKNGWCPVQNLAFERAKRACEELGDKVEFREINTLDRNVLLDWGISDALYINNKSVRTGPPPSYQKIKRKIEKKVNKL